MTERGMVEISNMRIRFAQVAPVPVPVPVPDSQHEVPEGKQPHNNQLEFQSGRPLGIGNGDEYGNGDESSASLTQPET